MSLRVEIVDYDARWPAMFAAEHARLAAAFEAASVRGVIEHMGSTSVPGLAAKPIIDVMVGLDEPAALDLTGEEPWRAYEDRDLEPRGSEAHVRLVRAVQALGYVYRGEAAIAGRLFFRRNTGSARTNHLHVAARGSDAWVNHLLFRDFLRAHPAAAEIYARTKRELAARLGHDRAAYTDAKTPLIRELMDQARTWADQTEREA